TNNRKNKAKGNPNNNEIHKGHKLSLTAFSECLRPVRHLAGRLLIDASRLLNPENAGAHGSIRTIRSSRQRGNRKRRFSAEVRGILGTRPFPLKYEHVQISLDSASKEAYASN